MPTFVFRPGGVAAGNVYTTWPSLMTAVGAVSGPKWIWIDASLATATVSAGTWNVDQCTFGTYGNDSDFIGGTLNFGNGTHFSFTTLTLDGPVTFQVTGTATAVATMVNGGTLNLTNSAAIFCNPGAAPFAVTGVPSSSCKCVVTRDAQIGDGTHAVLGGTDNSTTFFVLAFDRGNVDSNFWANAGAVCGLVIGSDASLIGTTFPGVSESLQSLASQELYVANVLGNWNPVPVIVGGTNPNATVPGGALDQIVAPNFVQIISGANANFSTLSTTSLTRKRAGLFLLTAHVSGTDSTGETVSVTLLRDGLVIASSPILKLPAVNVGTPGFGGSLQWVDQITDTSAHFWGVHAVGSNGGTLGISSGGASIEAVEL